MLNKKYNWIGKKKYVKVHIDGDIYSTIDDDIELIQETEYYELIIVRKIKTTKVGLEEIK
jgi:hypothetical protein